MIRGGNVNIIIGIMIGIMITISWIVLSPTGYFANGKIMDIELMECEKDLPRNQRCYIIAVPPSKD